MLGQHRFPAPPRHRRAGRTCVSTRGWRRFNPPAHEGAVMSVLPLSFVNFRDLAPPTNEGPPRALRALGFVAMATVLVSTLFTDPKPSLHGDGPLVIARDRRPVGAAWCSPPGAPSGSPGARFIGLALVGGRDARLRRRPARQRGLRGRLLRDGDRRHPAQPRRRDPDLRRDRRRPGRDPADRAREPGRDRRAAVLGAAVVPDHAADPPAGDAQQRGAGARRGAARVARRARRVRRAGRARPGRARAARRARPLALRARPAARGLAAAGA